MLIKKNTKIAPTNVKMIASCGSFCAKKMKSSTILSILRFLSHANYKYNSVYKFMKMLSWNVNGLRAILKKNFMQFVDEQKPDILCLQETKINQDPSINLSGYHSYYNFAQKKGYSGTAIFTKQKPLSIQFGMGIDEHDKEGRIICAEYENFILINSYTPNSGTDGLARLSYRQKWDNDFLQFILNMQKIKPLIICGDLNVAHNEIDLARPKQNTKNAGFTKEEREGFERYMSNNFIDTFRHLYPKIQQYSWWSYRFNARSKNIGWRIDYFLLSESLLPKLKDSFILQDVIGSDHAPVGIKLD